jgi:hypothetical protein
MVLDLATKKERPLAPELPDQDYGVIAVSASGALAAVQRQAEVIEVDVAAAKVKRRLDAGNDTVSGLTYVGEDLWVTRGTSTGDIWVADLR